MGRFKRTAINSLILFSSIILCLVVTEAAFRFYRISSEPIKGPIQSAMEKIFQLTEDPVLKYEFVPRFKADESFVGLQMEKFEINSEGFRDFEFQREKSKDVKRIVVLGDSISAGNNVKSISDVYPRVLEKIFAKHINSKKIEIINLAVPGYHTLQEARLLMNRADAYRPDAVIIGFCWNDIYIEADGGVFETLLKKARLDLKRGLLSMLDERLRGTFHFYRYFSERFRKPPNHVEYDFDGASYVHTNPAVAGLELVSRLQEKYGFKVYLFLIPWLEWNKDKEVPGQYLKTFHKIKVAAEKYPHIQVYDLLSDFKNLSNNADIFTSTYGPELKVDRSHPNAYGHKAIAEFIFKKIGNQLR